MFWEHRKRLTYLASLIIVSHLFSGCVLMRGLLFETGGITSVRGGLTTFRTAGFAVTEVSMIRNTVKTGVVGSRVVGVSELAAGTMVIELQNFDAVMSYFNRVRIGDMIGNQRSLYIVENGRNLEIGRALGITSRGETIVQF